MHGIGGGDEVKVDAHLSNSIDHDERVIEMQEHAAEEGPMRRQLGVPGQTTGLDIPGGSA